MPDMMVGFENLRQCRIIQEEIAGWSRSVGSMGKAVGNCLDRVDWYGKAQPQSEQHHSLGFTTVYCSECKQNSKHACIYVPSVLGYDIAKLFWTPVSTSLQWWTLTCNCKSNKNFQPFPHVAFSQGMLSRQWGWHQVGQNPENCQKQYSNHLVFSGVSQIGCSTKWRCC